MLAVGCLESGLAVGCGRAVGVFELGKAWGCVGVVRFAEDVKSQLFTKNRRERTSKKTCPPFSTLTEQVSNCCFGRFHLLGWHFFDQGTASSLLVCVGRMADVVASLNGSSEKRRRVEVTDSPSRPVRFPSPLPSNAQVLALKCHN